MNKPNVLHLIDMKGGCGMHILSLVFVLAIVLGYSSAIAGEHTSLKPETYTAHNIWWERRSKLMCINYKRGTIIPAGTPVASVTVTQEINPFSQMEEGYISFKRVDTGEEFRVGMRSKFHPGKTLADCKNNMFTSKTFEQMISGFTETEVNAVKSGILVEGMSKAAVLMSYGHPPEHATPSLSGNIWYYWTSRMRRKAICFDDTERTIKCKKTTEEADRL